MNHIDFVQKQLLSHYKKEGTSSLYNFLLTLRRWKKYNRVCKIIKINSEWKKILVKFYKQRIVQDIIVNYIIKHQTGSQVYYISTYYEQKQPPLFKFLLTFTIFPKSRKHQKSTRPFYMRNTHCKVVEVPPNTRISYISTIYIQYLDMKKL